MKPSKMRRRLMGLSIFAIMGVSLFSTGANVLTAKAAGAEVSINETNFPDSTFREYVKGFDTDGNGSFSSYELQAVTVIDVEYEYIESLKGIEYFTALEVLNCDNNDLTSLDVSRNTSLYDLNCGGNGLTSLDVSRNTALTELCCGWNKLTSLDVSRNTALTVLNCGWNELTSLDVCKNTTLESLYCDNNGLTSLDVSRNTALINLDCYGNQLTSLDVSRNTYLESLICSINQLISLDISNNTVLTELSCFENQLTNLDVRRNAELTFLNCDDNIHTITLSVGNRFDMSTLSGMDVSKVSNIKGGTLKGNILTVDSGAKEVTYTYDCGNGNTSEFRFVIDASVSSAEVVINGINFPDSTFRGYVRKFDTDGNNRFSSDELQAVTEIDVSGTYSEPGDIASLKGVEYFYALESLYCCINQLTSLDVSMNTALIDLVCYDNQLTSLDVSNNVALRSLYCYNNQLTSLDVSMNTVLTELDCDVNQLKSLDVSRNTALTKLGCGGNQLTSLDVSKNTALESLDCSVNRLKNLDVSRNTALIDLGCYDNQLTSLDVSNNTALYQLDCSRNQLTSLDISTSLCNLVCGENELTSLDVSKNTALEALDCGKNQLTSLDVSNNTALFWLKCYENELTSLDVSKNTALEILECGSNRLTSLDVSRNTALYYLNCGSNQLTSLDVSNNTALSLDCNANIYTITIYADNTFDMSTLPGMNVSKVSKIKGGTIKGNVLTVGSGIKEVTYIYDCGNGNTVEFKLVVKESISSAKVTIPKSNYTCTGSAITPAVTVTYGGKKLVAGTDYTVTYSSNKVVGTATVTITGKGDYLGTIKKTFEILPSSTTVKSLANATKGITIKWNKVPEAGGYIIYRSKNGGKFSKIKTISSSKTVSYTDKSATTNGTKYQYKIVAYKKVGKITYNSASSKEKTIYRMSAPKIKELRNKFGKKIAVKWTKNKKATGYQIQYATNSKFKKAKTITVKKASSVSKVITKLKKKSTYRVRVRAYKTVSGTKYYSAWSSKKSVKVRK